MAISILLRDDNRAIGHAGPLLFMHANSPPTVEVLDRLEREILELAKTRKKICFMVVVRAGANGRPSPEARQRLVTMLHTIAPVCLGEATVVEAKGLVGTIVRTFITGLTLMTGTGGHPKKVFAQVNEALDWFTSLPGQAHGFAAYRAELQTYFADDAKKSA